MISEALWYRNERREYSIYQSLFFFFFFFSDFSTPSSDFLFLPLTSSVPFTTSSPFFAFLRSDLLTSSGLPSASNWTRPFAAFDLYFDSSRPRALACFSSGSSVVVPFWPFSAFFAFLAAFSARRASLSFFLSFLDFFSEASLSFSDSEASATSSISL